MEPRAPALALACALALAAPRAAAQDAEAPGAWVIEPGQEALLLEMFGRGASLPGGCALAGVRVERSRAEATYRCGSRAVALSAVHPTAAPAGVAAPRTERFALVPSPGPIPSPLLDALTARVRARESAWRWTSIAPPPLAPSAVAGDAAVGAATRQGLSAPQEARYQQGFALYRARRYGEAAGVFLALARDNPCCGVLGMVVASFASTAPTADVAARYAREADADPGDTLKQFVAGTVAHYAAHHTGRSREEKQTLYASALRYLERCRGRYDFEPRLFIYLAVSHFRLGHQREAEGFIERAVTLGQDDPDVFYCRAEIFQRTAVARSLEDIDRYLAMMAVFEARGAVSDPAKTARVQAMRRHLELVSRGEASPEEIFDPIASEPPPSPAWPSNLSDEAPPDRSATLSPSAPAARSMGAPPRPAASSPKRYAALVLGLAAALALGRLLLRRG